MMGIRRRLRDRRGGAVVALAAWAMILSGSGAMWGQAGKAPVKIAGNFDKVKALPPGGAAPRLADGHPDLTGRWYPNSAGRMLQGAYPVDAAAMRQFDPKETPEAVPTFKSGVDPKYTRVPPYGECDQAGTPSVTLEQSIQHAPMELVHTPGRLALMYEYPLDVRMVYLNRRAHPADPDVTFNGDSTARWEGDTLVVEAIAIDERLRIISGVSGGNGSGSGVQWFPSARMRVTERYSRPSKNYLIYQVTIEDPEVLAKPWTSAPHRWSLAPADDEWAEVFCTQNEEPDFWKRMDPKYKQEYERQNDPRGMGRGGQ